MSQRVMLVVGTPPEAFEAVLAAISGAGGGIVGDYTHCSFSNPGDGTFMPGPDAHPHIGEQGVLSRVPEMRIETFCDRDRAKAVIDAVRSVHPYEEPVFYIVPLLEESEL